MAKKKKPKKIKVEHLNCVPYQLCPKCNGQGLVSRPPHIPGDVQTWSSGDSSPYQCNVCDGKMIIPMHIVEENTVDLSDVTYENFSMEGIG